MPSIGTVSSGRGGTNVSHSDNGVLILDNPAGLVNMDEGMQFDMDTEFIYPEVKYKDPFDSDYSKHTVFIIPTLSFIYKNSSENPLAFGVGAFAPAGLSTEYHLDHFSQRRFTNNMLSFGKEVYNSGASGWNSAFDRFDIELTDGDNRFLNRVLGTVVNDNFPIGWDDSFAFKFGYEHFINGSADNILRAGYIYNENPDPHGSQIPLIP